MPEFDALLRENPKAEKHESTIRAAFAALKELQDSGITSDEYDLASPYGTAKPHEGKSRTNVRMGYSR